MRNEGMHKTKRGVHKGAVVTNTPKRPIVSRGAKTGREGDVKKANKEKISATMLAHS